MIEPQPAVTRSRQAELADRARCIRAQIASLHEDLSAVLEEQNTFPPVGRVSNDVLALVFMRFVAEMEQLGALMISHVCRRWRALALAFPVLWANISIGSRTRTMVFLERSGESPLSILARPMPWQTLAGLGTFLTPHMHRIRRLHLYSSDHFKTEAEDTDDTDLSDETLSNASEISYYSVGKLDTADNDDNGGAEEADTIYGRNNAREGSDDEDGHRLPADANELDDAQSRHTKWMAEFRSPAPVLEDLRIVYPQRPYARCFARAGREALRMFRNHTPGLRSLTLSGLVCPPTFPLFYNLVRLELDGMGTAELPLHAILQILQRSPDLKSLKIKTPKSVRQGDARDSASALHVELPRLSELRAVRASVSLPLLLHNITAPCISSLHIHEEVFPATFASLPTLLPALVTALSHVRHIRQRVVPHGIYRKPTYSVTLSTHGDADAVLHARFERFDDASAAQCATALAALCDLGALVTCTLYDCLALHSDTWVRQLARMKGLRVLCVRGAAHSDGAGGGGGGFGNAARALLTLLSALAGDAEMCPALERLEFEWSWGKGGDLKRCLGALAERRPSLVLVRLSDRNVPEDR